MSHQFDETVDDSHSLVMTVGGLLVTLIGAAALTGWITGYQMLTGGVAGFIPVAPNAGFVFMLLGAALCAVGAQVRLAATIAYGASSIGLLIAAARLIEYLTGVTINVDQWLLSVPSETFGLAPVGRMAFFTALSFTFSSVALIATVRARASSAADDVARALSLLTCLSGTVFLLGYLYDSPLIFGGRGIPMALPSAVGFVLTGLSIWVPSLRRARAMRRESEMALRSSERLFAAAFEHAAQGIALVGLDGRFLKVNAPLCSLTGFDETELLARASQELMHVDDRQADAALAEQLLTGEIPSYRLEKRLVRKDGTLMWALSARSLVRDDAGRPLYFVAHFDDVTPRRDAERATREQEELYRTFARHFPRGAVALFDRDARFLLVDGEEVAAVGLDPSAMVGRLPHECLDEALCAAMEPAMRSALMGEDSDTDVTHGERHLRRFCGPVYGLDGAVAYGMLLLQDITERKRLEVAVRSQAEELARSNEELERFAYLASHDLQEPLRTVTSYTQLLAKRYRGKLDEDADTFIGYAVEGASRMQQLIRDLLVYSRVDSQGNKFATVDLQQVMQGVLQDLSIRIEESGAEVTHDALPCVNGDATQLRQLLQNLLDNALKYQRPGVTPRVHLSVVREESAWHLTMADNGIGISPEFRERIFVIFQRLHTREAYPGTGLGLALARRVAERHGGRLWVDAGPDQGSLFHLMIPIAPADEAIAQVTK